MKVKVFFKLCGEDVVFLVSGLSKSQLYNEIEQLLNLRPLARILAIDCDSFTESNRIFEDIAMADFVYARYNDNEYGIIKHRHGPLTQAAKKNFGRIH